MRRFVLGILVCSSCASSQREAESPSSIRYAGGDGSSCATSIQILGAPNERAGVKAEYDWLATHRVGYSMVNQALTDCSGRNADKLTIAMPDGRQQQVFFDISDFFGKL